MAINSMPKLTIELVPKSCWFSNVRDHVSKEQWNKIRQKIYRNADYVCQVCGRGDEKGHLECHEIWQYDDNNFLQKLTGLIALCSNCHMVKYIGLAQIQGNNLIAKTHLAQVNNWDDETTENYIKNQKSIWIRRSKFKWKLDLHGYVAISE
jgi:hypothetical protein